MSEEQDRLARWNTPRAQALRWFSSDYVHGVTMKRCTRADEGCEHPEWLYGLCVLHLEDAKDACTTKGLTYDLASIGPTDEPVGL